MLLGCSVVLLLNAFLFAKAIDDQEINNATTGCPHRAFIGCILQLKEEHIQFDRNIVRVILGVNSEAKLLHTCKSYTNVLPCFRARVLECGNDQQKDMLIDVGKALMFLCSPFSLTRQRTLIRHQACMAKVLSLPISAGCKLNKKVHADRLDSCKRHCSTMPKNFTCSLQTWISEQNACTLNDLIDHCGEDAANFYSDLQASIFEPSYPFICQHDRNQLATSNQHIATPPSPSLTAKTDAANLFTGTYLGTKKPYRQPMFYISPQSTTFVHPTGTSFVHPTGTTMSKTKIAPRVETTTAQIQIVTSQPITLNQVKSQKANSTLLNKNTQTVTAAQATLLVLLQKLLPLALRSNLTNLLSQRNEILELSRRIDFKHLLQNSTARREHRMPQQNPEISHLIHVTPSTQPTTQSPPSTTNLAFTVQSVTATKQTASTNAPMMQHPTASHARQSIQVQKTFRSWYFAVSSTENEQ